ncbi:MAG: hypothetical protein PHR30_08340 [Gallionellaceae bacterium]|nr:hypothetical protein [Gallionellaceae bacterium]
MDDLNELTRIVLTLIDYKIERDRNPLNLSVSDRLALDREIERLEQRKHELENDQKIDEEDCPTAKPMGVTGLTAKAVLAHDWPLPPGVKLKGLLSDGRAEWLSEARTFRGSGGKCPSLWNPAMLAICMESREKGKTWTANHHHLDKHIREHFADWVDEWERLCEIGQPESIP